MAIWSSEIKELEKLYVSLKGQLPDLGKELTQIFHTEDANVIMLYSRRCLEVIVSDLCDCELKRPRKTQPLKGIIDKLHYEEKVPSHIITSMHGLNELSTYGAHPKDFDPEQVKPVLINLDIIIKWYLNYKVGRTEDKVKQVEEVRQVVTNTEDVQKRIQIPGKRLTSFIAGSILLIVIVVAVLFFTNIIGGGKKIQEIEKSIAVLPFRNDSPDTTNTYFINGIMEMITTNLQMVKVLRVISRTSVEQYRNNKTKSISEIAKELDVNYIIEGSGQKYGNSFSVTTQLIKTKGKETHLWAKTYEQEIKEVNDYIRIESQIAQAVATELKATITPEEKRLIEKIPTTSLRAHDAYLKGNCYIFGLNQTHINADSALKYFELAQEIDPKYALAYAGISYVWRHRVEFGIVSIADGNINIIQSIKKAIDLDSTSAEIQCSFGTVLSNTLWDWENSELAYRKAIELNPNLAEAHAFYSILLSELTRNKEALKYGKAALKLDPKSPYVINAYAVDLFYARQYDEALRTMEEVFKVYSLFPPTLSLRPYVLHMAGRYEEALKAFKIFYEDNYLKDYDHAFDVGFAKGGYANALRMEADTLYSQVNKIKVQHFLYSDLVMLYVLGGDREKALAFLEVAYREKDPQMPCLLLPVFDSLRDEPRFQKIASKMNLSYK